MKSKTLCRVDCSGNSSSEIFVLSEIMYFQSWVTLSHTLPMAIAVSSSDFLVNCRSQMLLELLSDHKLAHDKNCVRKGCFQQRYRAFFVVWRLLFCRSLIQPEKFTTMRKNVMLNSPIVTASQVLSLRFIRPMFMAKKDVVKESGANRKARKVSLPIRLDCSDAFSTFFKLMLFIRFEMAF